jgi:hypothetical protein
MWKNLLEMNAHIVGNIGLYFVCYELSKRGWNVMPTARNAKGIDIIAYNLTATRYIGVQVKSLSKKNPVPLGNSLEKIISDFWIIVNDLEGTPGIFLLRPDEVKARAHRTEKEGKVAFWLEPKSYQVPDFQGRWDRIADQTSGVAPGNP